MFRYIVRYKRKYDGHSPSTRELAAVLGTSTSMVQQYLGKLEEVGWIERPDTGQARMIMIPGAEWRYDNDRARNGWCRTDEAIQDEPADEEALSLQGGLKVS